MCDVVLRNIRVGSVVVEIRNSMENHIIASLKRTLIAATSILLSAALAPAAHAASQYIQHNLVSDVPGLADLYFTAGIPGPGNIEDHGLFGSIQVGDGSAAPKAQASLANISNFAFVPPTITIAAGTQVQWTNQDGFAHTVTADDARFQSNSLEHNDTYSQTFSAVGTYSYHCSIHPFMKRKIVVQ